MGLIQGFKYDVFVSYNHADDLKGVVGRVHHGWVDAFAAKLENALQESLKYECQRAGRKFKIFWDYKLEKDQPFDTNLREIVRNSAMFLTIMSSNYLQSAWCVKELDWFFEIMDSRRGHLVSAEDWHDMWPAVIARVGPVDRTNLPDERLSSILGFKFYDENRETQDPRYNYPSPDATQADNDLFYPEFNELQTTLANKTRTILNHQSDDQAEKSVVTRTKGVIVLATEDLKSDRDQFIKRFQSSGARLDELTFSSSGAGTDMDDIHDHVSRSSALVLLLGIYPGLEQVSARMRAALDAAKANKIPTFLWLQPNYTPEFIETLPDAVCGNYKALVREVREQLDQSDLDQLTTTIQDCISQQVDSRAQDDSRHVKLFIDADKLDLSLADQIVDILKQPVVQAELQQRRVKLRTWLAKEGSDQRDHAERWNNLVKRCDGVIIVYGQIDEDAIDMKLDEIDRVSSKRKLDPSTAQKSDIEVAILEGPPPDKGIIVEQGVRTFEYRSGVTEKDIIDFVAELASTREVSASD